VVHAAIDALRDYGVRHMDMPLTPERVWRTIQHAKGRQRQRHSEHVPA
jgi:carbon-monoxide dehydrogenase large subunit